MRSVCAALGIGLPTALSAKGLIRIGRLWAPEPGSFRVRAQGKGEESSALGSIHPGRLGDRRCLRSLPFR